MRTKLKTYSRRQSLEMLLGLAVDKSTDRPTEFELFTDD